MNQTPEQFILEEQQKNIININLNKNIDLIDNSYNNNFQNYNNNSNNNIISNQNSKNQINTSSNESQLQDKSCHQVNDDLIQEIDLNSQRNQKNVEIGINLQTINSLERQLKKDMQHCVYKKDLILAKEMFKDLKEQLDQIFELTNGSIINNEHMKNKLSKLCHNMNKIEKALLIDNLPYLCSFVEQINQNSSELVSSQLFTKYQERQMFQYGAPQNQLKPNNKLKSYQYNNEEIQENSVEYSSEMEYVKPQVQKKQKQQNQYVIDEDQKTGSVNEDNSMFLSDEDENQKQTNRELQEQQKQYKEIQKKEVSISNNLYNVNNVIRSQNRKPDNVDVYINRIGNINSLQEKNDQNIELFQKIVFLKQDIQLLVDCVKFCQAFTLYDQLLIILNKLESNQPNLEAQTKILNFKKENERFFEKLNIARNDIFNAEKWLKEEQGWKIDKKTDKMCIKYRIEEGSPIVIMRMECKMKVPVRNLISMIYEVELYKKWFPFCKSTECIGNPTNHSKINYLRISPPILSDRESFMTGFGVDKMESDGHLLICAKSIDLDEKFCKEYNVVIPEINKSIVRGFLTVATFRITPITEDECNLELVMHYDGKFVMIPSGLINFITVKFARLFLDRLESYCKPKKFNGSVWDKQVQSNREFYGWIEETFAKEMAIINKKREKQKQEDEQNLKQQNIKK